jgi:hypothetical protein
MPCSEIEKSLRISDKKKSRRKKCTVTISANILL